MTLQEFNQTRWGAGMWALYRGQRLRIAQVDFEEALIGMVDERYDSDEDPLLQWARCENVTLINN